MTQSPLERYQKDLLSQGFRNDASQMAAIEHLQALYEKLVEEYRRTTSHGVLSNLMAKILRTEMRSVITGIYLWGGVGRGKTYLMDIFYESLPIENKMRTHFHRFMRRVHEEMRCLSDQSDPLVIVARRLADEARVVCFDEFFVSDITDAMILANLLEAMFDLGVVLVATSNIEPEDLYRDGLQRQRFLPAIDLLKQRTLVVNVEGGIDYRLRTLEQAPLYYTPHSHATHANLDRFFQSLVPDHDAIRSNTDIEIEGRKIRTIKEAEDVVWFEFKALCDGPRSQNDYIELAREYHAVIVENVPVFGGHNDDQARRFLYMVDEFYDRGVKLILSAQTPVEQLYQSGRLSFEFERSVSRIREMQSKAYLARAHKA